MMAKPPLLLMLNNPAEDLLQKLSAAYELRDEPAADIRGVVTTGARGIAAAEIDALPALGVIAVHGVGYDKVDLPRAKARGIAVANTPDVLTDDVADLTIALMLAAVRRVPLYDRFVRDGRWPAEGSPPLTGKFTGCRVGLIGMGRIGKAIAERLVPFRVEIAYHSRHARTELPWRHEPLAHSLAEWCDMLVLAVPGGAETDNLVDAAMIDALGPRGILVNISRGSIVDEPALVAALVDGRLGGAALDVFVDEPNVPQALLQLDNVVLQPHRGSATVETRAAMTDLVIANLAAFYAGEPLITPV
jgi:hydroxypyruvate reductase